MARLDSRLLVLFLLACGQPEALQTNTLSVSHNWLAGLLEVEDFWREKAELFWLFGGTKPGGE